jgi:multidrug efflux system membrane fusion protein
MSEPQPGQTPFGSPHFMAPPPRKRPVWRTLLWILLAIVAAVVLVVVLTPHDAKRPGGRGGGGGGGRRPPTVVGTAIAAPGEMPVVLDALGTVTPEATVVVHTRIAGTLMKVLFREGQLVHEGDVIAEVDERPYVIAVTQAEGQLLRDQAALDDARLDLKRYKTLQAQDSVSGQQVDTQAALVKQDEGVVRTDQASLANAKLNVIYCHITAPVSGRIGLRAVDAGNYVQTGDANGVATITTLDPIDVVFTLPEDNIPQVNARTATGATLPVTAFDRAGATTLASGQLSTLDNQVDTSTGTVKAKARFANPVGALFPSQFVNARLLVDTLHDVIIVPTSAVRHGPKGDFVYTVDDPTGDPSAKMVIIKLGPADGERTAVLSGLQAGDMVITEGGDRLRDGATVILPGHAPPNGFGARPQAQGGGLFGWLSGLFGAKPAADQTAAAGGGQAGSGGGYAGGAQGGGGAGSPAAGGHEAGPGGGGRGARMQAMLAQLGLDPAQKAKADAILAEARQKAQAGGGDPDAFRAAMRDANAKLKAILRPDQQAKFDELRAQMRGGRGGGGGEAPTAAQPGASSAPQPAAAPAFGGHEGGQAGGPGGGRGARMQAMLAQLGLDPAQKAQADALFAEARQKAQAGGGDPDAFRAAMRDANAKLKAILRPDQQAKFDELRAQMRGGGGGGAPGGGGNE